MLTHDDETTIDDGAPMSEPEAARRLGLKVAALRAWRQERRGLAFVRLERAIRYLPADIDEFINANRERAAASSE